MLVTVGRTTSALGTLLASGSFAVNYLAADGQAIADTFSGRTGAKGAQRFDGIDWKAGSHGAPLLGAAFGILECSVVETIERYETAIVIGALHRATHRPGAPLVYLGGKALAPAH
jgi:flavin reductase (DIM6/NTAB) family NADH-FMN oxidoreductase RutF